MFIGRNEVILNEATMIEAVQEYLDKRINDSEARPNFVVSIKPFNNQVGTYTVTLTDKKAEVSSGT